MQTRTPADLGRARPGLACQNAQNPLPFRPEGQTVKGPCHIRTAAMATAASWPFKPAPLVRASAGSQSASLTFKTFGAYKGCKVEIYLSGLGDEICFYIPKLDWLHAAPAPATPEEARSAAEAFCRALGADAALFLRHAPAVPAFPHRSRP